MANDIDLNKVHSTAAYQNTAVVVEATRLDKTHTTAAYQNTAVTFEAVRLDKVHVMAAYRYQEVQPSGRRSQNIIA